MRYLISLFLAVCLCMNAAHAAASGIHEAVEHGGDLLFAVFAGDVDHAHEHDGSHGAPDADDMTQTHADHHHVHPPLVSLLPCGALDLVVDGRHLPLHAERDALVSVSPSRLERPPRAFLA